MSDALTDIARHNARGRAYEQYLKALLAFLKDPTDERRAAVVKAAEETDNVRGGYWSGGGSHTNLVQGLAERAALLLAGDRAAWAKFLASLEEDGLRQDFKKLSPFKDKLIVLVDYGQGFVTLGGEAKCFFDEIIRAKGWRTYDCDDYLIVLDKPDIANAEAHWLRCGIAGVTGPRERRR